MLGKILPAVALGGVALLWPELSWRVGTLQLATADEASLKKVTTFKEQQIKHADILKNCEDAIVLEDLGVAILSCDPQRDAWNTVMGTFIDPSQPGAIFQWFYSDPDAYPQPLALEGFGTRGTHDFHPLGLAYHEDSSTLFVANHASTGPTVELFSYAPWGGFGRASATHKATVAHPLLHTPNSIHALGEASFLVTNDHFFRARDRFVLSQLESYAALPGGSVVHVALPSPLPAPTTENDDDETAAAADSMTSARSQPLTLGPDTPGLAAATVARGIPFANGIAVMDAGATLAVASTTGRSVELYAINSNNDTTVTLTHKRTTPRAPALLDNLSVDSRNRLLAAGHPRPAALSATVARRARCLALRAKAHAVAAVAEEEVDRALGADAAHEQREVSDEEDIAAAVTKRTVEVVMAEEEKAGLEACARDYDGVGPSWVGELVVGGGEGGEDEWKEVFVGGEYGTSCTAARDVKEGVVLVVGLYDRGVLVGRE